jgi:small-conductance mechanosensitive channel
MNPKADAPDSKSPDLSRFEAVAAENTDPRAISRAYAAPPKLRVDKSDAMAAVTYGVILVVLAAAQWFIDWKWTSSGAKNVERVLKYVHGATLLVLVLLASKLLEIFAIGRLRDHVTRYNLKRVLHLLVAFSITGIVVSVLFANWRAAVVSLGLVSLILGFALQTPISSFIGWIYILVRRPYRVGDRIKIDDLKGDVIDVSYIDTTLWEFGGDYLTGDHPSGRVIKFPNSTVFNTAVINYSWPLFPYVWNEIKFNVAYETDLEFVASTMQRIVEEEMGAGMIEKVIQYRELLSETPVDHLAVQEKPAVCFRVSENTWLEAIVRYLVHPREAGGVKSRLVKKLLTALKSNPDQVLFPKSNAR